MSFHHPLALISSPIKESISISKIWWTYESTLRITPAITVTACLEIHIQFSWIMRLAYRLPHEVTFVKYPTVNPACPSPLQGQQRRHGNRPVVQWISAESRKFPKQNGFLWCCLKFLLFVKHYLKLCNNIISPGRILLIIYHTWKWWGVKTNETRSFLQSHPVTVMSTTALLKILREVNGITWKKDFIVKFFWETLG